MPVNVEISKRLVLINSAANVTAQLIGWSVLVWVHQYLLRRIAPSEYAVYPVIASIMVFTPLLGMLLTGGVARYIVEAYTRGDTQRVTRIVSSVMPPLTLLVLAFVSFGCVAAWFIGDIFRIEASSLDDARLMLGLMVLSQGLGLWLAPLTVGLIVRQRYVLAGAIKLGSMLVRVILLIVLLVGVSPRVLWVVVAMVAAQTVAQAATLILSRRLAPDLRFRRGQHDWAIVSELTVFGAATVLAGVAYRIGMSADPIILNELSTSDAVASYYVGGLVDRNLSAMTSEARGPLLPPLTAMHATGDREGLRRAFTRGNRYSLWIAMLAAVPLIVFGEPLTRLYVGDRYLAAATVMLFLSATYPLSNAVVMIYPVCVAMARVWAFFIASLGLQLSNFALTIYLVGWLGLGATGSALGTFISAAVWYPLVIWPLGLRVLNLPLRRFLRETLIPGLAPAVGAFIVGFLLLAWREPTDWWTLGAFVTVTSASYFATILAVSLQPEDRKDLAALVDGFRAMLVDALRALRGVKPPSAGRR